MHPRCPSCNKKYTKHMGLHGLCKQNIELKKQVGLLRTALLNRLDTSEYMFEVIKELKLRGYPEIENRNSAKKEVQDLIAIVEKLAESKHQAEISEMKNEQFVKKSRYEQEILELKAKVKRLECGIDQSQEYFKELQKWGVSVATAGSPARQVRTAIDCSFAGSKRKWEDSEKSLMSKIAGLEKELKEARSINSAMGTVSGYVYSNLKAHSIFENIESEADDDIAIIRKANAKFLKEEFERFSSIFSEYRESVESEDPVVIRDMYPDEEDVQNCVDSGPTNLREKYCPAITLLSSLIPVGEILRAEVEKCDKGQSWDGEHDETLRANIHLIDREFSKFEKLVSDWEFGLRMGDGIRKLERLKDPNVQISS